MNGAQRDQTQSLGFKALQVYGSVPGGAGNDPFGNTYSFSNLALLLMTGARYQYEDTYGDAIFKLKQVADTPGIIGNWIIWPADNGYPRTLSQIAQVFPVKISGTGKARPIQFTGAGGPALDMSLKELIVPLIDGAAPAAGSLGYVVAGTHLGVQSLMFLPTPPPASSGGGGGGGYYGDAFHGDITINGGTNNEPLVYISTMGSADAFGQSTNVTGRSTTAGGRPIAAGTILAVAQGALYCRNLTIASNVVLFLPVGCDIFCTDTLQNDGEVTTNFGVARIMAGQDFSAGGDPSVNPRFTSSIRETVGGQAGGSVGPSTGGNGFNPPFDEQGSNGGGTGGAGAGGAGAPGGSGGKGRIKVGSAGPSFVDPFGTGAQAFGNPTAFVYGALFGGSFGLPNGDIISGGSGGGGGGLGATTSGFGTGGGGGSTMRVRARHMKGGGRFSADGQDGVNGGFQLGNNNGGADGAGGGGGGNPGVILTVSDDAPAAGLTFSTAPGIGGLGMPGGGSPGTSGGGSGYVAKITPTSP